MSQSAGSLKSVVLVAAELRGCRGSRCARVRGIVQTGPRFVENARGGTPAVVVIDGMTYDTIRDLMETSPVCFDGAGRCVPELLLILHNFPHLIVPMLPCQESAGAYKVVQGAGQVCRGGASS
jgi:hypothetical protein